MKRIHLPVLAAVAVFISVAAMAQMNHGSMQGGAMQGSTTNGNVVGKSSVQPADVAMGEGLVKKVDKTKGTVTLSHGALPNGMPPMTMAYKLKDAAWLDTLKAGQKIRFATDPADGGMTVTLVELAK
jgi:Cu/Ag efflux protein CusF